MVGRGAGAREPRDGGAVNMICAGASLGGWGEWRGAGVEGRGGGIYH